MITTGTLHFLALRHINCFLPVVQCLPPPLVVLDFLGLPPDLLHLGHRRGVVLLLLAPPDLADLPEKEKDYSIV